MSDNQIQDEASRRAYQFLDLMQSVHQSDIDDIDSKTTQLRQAHIRLEEVYVLALKLRSDLARCEEYAYDYKFFNVIDDFDPLTMTVDPTTDTNQREGIQATLLPLVVSHSRRNLHDKSTVVCKALVLA